jgi:CheY-like chemotaxis protein
VDTETTVWREIDPPRRRGILVADDAEPIRNMLAMFFQRQGIPFWLTSNGIEAVETYRQHREEIGLVLLDVRMPKMDGPHAFAQLKEMNPDVTCYFMSGDIAPYTEEMLLEMGAPGLLVKPFLVRALGAIVSEFEECACASA